MKAHFPALHGFRAIAALGVFIHHCEEFKKFSGINSIGHYKGINSLGTISVTAFFVLSGFLLSYLLMQEKDHYQNINIKKFYWKRILRIWPLYMLTLVLYKCIMPNLPIDILQAIENMQLNTQFEAVSIVQISPLTEWICLILFLPHVLLALGIPFNPAHTWSIGVEEMFYIFWPWLIYFSRNYWKTYIKTIVIYLILFLSSLSIILYFNSQPTKIEIFQIAKFIFSFLFFERISCMAIGALAAYMFLYHKEKTQNFFCNHLVIFFSSILLILLIRKGVMLPVLMNEVYSVLFAIVILYIINIRSWISNIFSNKILHFLGEISYGLYMFNPFTIIISIEIFKKLNLSSTSHIDGYLLFYTIALSITILISYLSYKFFERPILKYKRI